MLDEFQAVLAARLVESHACSDLMLRFTVSLKVFLAIEPNDMCKDFERLHAAVRARIKKDVRSGASFVFTRAC